MRLLGLGTLGRALRERGVRGEGARTALGAVARVFDALLLTRCVSRTNMRSSAFRGTAERYGRRVSNEPRTLFNLVHPATLIRRSSRSFGTIFSCHQNQHPCDATLISATRSLAARQCAQVRTELALAIGRLSTRSTLVSDTRTAARRASAHHRTLLLRLVDLELRHWRGLAAAAAAPENVQVRRLDGAKAQSSIDNWDVFGHGAVALAALF